MNQTTLDNFRSFNPQLQAEIIALAPEPDKKILTDAIHNIPIPPKLVKPWQQTMTNLSDIIKDGLTMRQVVEFYLGAPKRNAWMCISHSDKHPSMTVKGKRFSCWSCNITGDVFDFVGKLHGLDFQGSVAMLARDFGYSDAIMSQADKNVAEGRKRAREVEAATACEQEAAERGKIELVGLKRSVFRALRKVQWRKWLEVECIVSVQNEIKLLDLELDGKCV